MLNSILNQDIFLGMNLSINSNFFEIETQFHTLTKTKKKFYFALVFLKFASGLLPKPRLFRVAMSSFTEFFSA